MQHAADMVAEMDPTTGQMITTVVAVIIHRAATEVMIDGHLVRIAMEAAIIQIMTDHPAAQAIERAADMNTGMAAVVTNIATDAIGILLDLVLDVPLIVVAMRTTTEFSNHCRAPIIHKYYTSHLFTAATNRPLNAFLCVHSLR